jgi:adenosinetriphosphatase
MLRRTKKDEIAELPGKKEIFVNVGLSKLQVEVYKNLLIKNNPTNSVSMSKYNMILMQVSK